MSKGFKNELVTVGDDQFVKSIIICYGFSIDSYQKTDGEYSVDIIIMDDGSKAVNVYKNNAVMKFNSQEIEHIESATSVLEFIIENISYIYDEKYDGLEVEISIPYII